MKVHLERVLILAFLSLWTGLTPVLGQVRIAEVDPTGDLPDALGRGEDWIELVNEGADPVSLSDLRLSEDPENWEKWSLPDVWLPPR